MVVAVGFTAAFLTVEKRAPVPILDRALLRRPGLARAVGAGCLDNYGWAACVFAVTLLLQVVRDLSPMETGTVFLALSAGTAVGGPLSGRLARRFSIGPTMALGLALSAAGLGWLAMLPTTGTFLVALAVTGMGVGIAYSTAIFATAEAAPAGDAGAAQGVTMTALIMTAAVAITACGMLIEQLSTTGRATDAAIRGVLVVGALVTAAGLLVLAVRLPGRVRLRGLSRRPSQDIGSRAKT